MKRAFVGSAVVAFLLLLSAIPVLASPPNKIIVNGYLSKAGIPIDTGKTFSVSIYDDAAGGSRKWGPFSYSIPVIKGNYELIFGDDNLKALDFTSSNYYLDLQVYDSPSWVPLSPRRLLAAHPYAFMAYSLKDGTVAASGYPYAVIGKNISVSSFEGRVGNYDSGVYGKALTNTWGKLGEAVGTSLYGIRGYANNTVTEGMRVYHYGIYASGTNVGVRAYSGSPTYPALYARNTHDASYYRGRSLQIGKKGISIYRGTNQAAGKVTITYPSYYANVTNSLAKSTSIVLVTAQNYTNAPVKVEAITTGTIKIRAQWPSGTTAGSVDVAYLIIN